MSRNARLLLLAALCVGVFLVGVELLVTAVALPFILADLADWTRLREASWIINGYLVAYVAVMPLAGRAADRYRVPTLFSASLVVFAIGSVAAGAAQSLEWLIVARVVQGLGAGAIVPLATAGASHLYEGPHRARALGVVGALTFLGMAAGPFIGARDPPGSAARPSRRSSLRHGAGSSTSGRRLPCWPPSTPGRRRRRGRAPPKPQRVASTSSAPSSSRPQSRPASWP